MLLAVHHEQQKSKEVYFTGMFTANQGDLSVQYYDPESGRIRHYYPDFLAKLEDGSYQLIEVKGDNKIDDTVVKAKAAAAQEMAVASGIEYKMYAGSEIMTTHILAYLDGMASTISYADHMQQGTLSMVAENFCTLRERQINSSSHRRNYSNDVSYIFIIYSFILQASFFRLLAVYLVV